MDDFAGLLWKKNSFSGKVFITGNPAFDRFLSVDTAAEREILRKKFSVSANDKAIFYAGQGTPRGLHEDKNTFKLLTDVLRVMSGAEKVRLVFRPHPRSEEISYYEEFSHGLNVVDTSVVHFSENLLPIADTVVSIFATNLIHACYLRIPSVAVMLTDGGGEILKALRLKDFPPNETGATVGFYKNDLQEFSVLLGKILFDEDFRAACRTRQAARFRLDGKSANRVARVLAGL